MNKKLLLLLIFPIYLQAVTFKEICMVVKNFAYALVDENTEMFSELGDRLADPSGDQIRPTQEERRNNAALAAEERYRRSKEEQLGNMLDELGGCHRPPQAKSYELTDLSS